MMTIDRKSGYDEPSLSDCIKSALFIIKHGDCSVDSNTCIGCFNCILNGTGICRNDMRESIKTCQKYIDSLSETEILEALL